MDGAISRGGLPREEIHVDGCIAARSFPLSLQNRIYSLIAVSRHRKEGIARRRTWTYGTVGFDCSVDRRLRYPKSLHLGWETRLVERQKLRVRKAHQRFLVHGGAHHKRNTCRDCWRI